MQKKTVIIIVVVVVVIIIVGSIIPIVVLYEHDKDITTPPPTTPPTTPPPTTPPPTTPPTSTPIPTLVPQLPNIPYVATQGNCTGDQCGGMIWTGVGTEPWDAYYKFQCADLSTGNVSDWTKEYGPFSDGYWYGPMVRVGANGTMPCSTGQKMNIQRRRGSTAYATINPFNFDQTTPYVNASSFYDNND